VVTASDDKGKLVIQSRACINCHTFFGNGAYYGPISPKLGSTRIGKPGRYRRIDTGRRDGDVSDRSSKLSDLDAHNA
jgi:hypothetical protein